jgi:uncharacterized membrane protein YbhN (UPF0104 family)
LPFLAPAGLGVREGVFAALLATDLSPEIAVVIAVLLRLMTTVTEVVVALVAIKLGFRKQPLAPEEAPAEAGPR